MIRVRIYVEVSNGTYDQYQCSLYNLENTEIADLIEKKW